jgi:hypothetical protein
MQQICSGGQCQTIPPDAYVDPKDNSLNWEKWYPGEAGTSGGETLEPVDRPYTVSTGALVSGVLAVAFGVMAGVAIARSK